MKGKTIYISGREGESTRHWEKDKRGKERGRKLKGEGESYNMEKKKMKKVKKKMDEMIKVDGETTT